MASLLISSLVRPPSRRVKEDSAFFLPFLPMAAITKGECRRTQRHARGRCRPDRGHRYRRNPKARVMRSMEGISPTHKRVAGYLPFVIGESGSTPETQPEYPL